MDSERTTLAAGVFTLTDLYGGLPPQQQLQTLAVVSQAAVVQRCAAFDRLLIQIQTAEGHKEREREENFKSQRWRH